VHGEGFEVVSGSGRVVGRVERVVVDSERPGVAGLVVGSTGSRRSRSETQIAVERIVAVDPFARCFYLGRSRSRRLETAHDEGGESRRRGHRRIAAAGSRARFDRVVAASVVAAVAVKQASSTSERWLSDRARILVAWLIVAYAWVRPRVRRLLEASGRHGRRLAQRSAVAVAAAGSWLRPRLRACLSTVRRWLLAATAVAARLAGDAWITVSETWSRLLAKRRVGEQTPADDSPGLDGDDVGGSAGSPSEPPDAQGWPYRATEAPADRRRRQAGAARRRPRRRGRWPIG
jgi:hypothetical protein